MSEPTRTIAATRLAGLVGAFDRRPAYAGLADALILLIGDGRIPWGTRLPSERDLTDALAVSRTTVARAYGALRDSGYAEARQGAGTFARVPGGRTRVQDRVLLPRPDDHDAIDLGSAAASAPPGVAAAYAAAAADLPPYLGGHGYYPAGLPVLQAAIAQSYADRGLPTEPDQIMVTPGALTATSIVATAFSGPRDRVLVESPVYPNAVQAIRNGGARVVGSPVDPGGWDLAAVGTTLREVAPALAYLIPDFQNPTGHLMSDAQREEYARHLRRSGAVAVVDEAHQALALDGQDMPLPFAAHAPSTITIGSASKTFWGGLRLGWIRAPRERMADLTRARMGLDLGSPVLEQLVLARLLADLADLADPTDPTDPTDVVDAHRTRLREGRDRLLRELTEQLPSWRFVRPGGGLSVWCELPAALGTALVEEAERRGVIISPGPAFAAEGGLDRFVRIPWTRSPDVLGDAVTRIAAAWDVVAARSPSGPRRPARVMVA